METYQIVLHELNTKKEKSLSVQVDEAEKTENIVIKAILNESDIVTSRIS